MDLSQDSNQMQASFSVLVLSIASSAAASLGLTENPQTGKKEMDLNLARFNIDLLMMLKDKTDGRRTEEENKLLQAVLSDLQVKFVQLKSGKS